MLWYRTWILNFHPFLTKVAFLQSNNALIPLCHTCFPKRNQVHLICAPGSVYTHMIDGMSEMPLTVFERISEFNHLLHSCGRLKGLWQRKTITTRRVFVFRSHRHLTGGPRASKLIVVVVELASIVLLWTAISKTEYTYGWYLESRGRCKAIKVG
jgi:hypothetical protein